MSIIQVVLFDLGGTLLHYEQPPENSFEALNARALGALLDAAAGVGTPVPDRELAIRAVGRMASAMEARVTRTQYANTAEVVISEGLEAIGVKLPARAWDVGLAAYYEAISAIVQPVAGDAPAALAQLAAQGLGLGLVSNTFWAPAMHDADLARFGLLDYLPARVYSCEFGMAKPHPSIYRHALDRLDVAPAEAVFVGDKLKVDVAGPQKLGMRAVLVRSPFRTESDPEITPDAMVDTIAELPALIATWDHALEAQVASAW